MARGRANGQQENKRNDLLHSVQIHPRDCATLRPAMRLSIPGRRTSGPHPAFRIVNGRYGEAGSRPSMMDAGMDAGRVPAARWTTAGHRPGMQPRSCRLEAFLRRARVFRLAWGSHLRQRRLHPSEEPLHGGHPPRPTPASAFSQRPGGSFCSGLQSLPAL